MRKTRFAQAAAAAVAAALVFGAAAGHAGSGIGATFTLGDANSVNATSTLSGTTAGAQLKVQNASTAANAFSVYALLSPTSPANPSAAVRAASNSTTGAGYGVWASHAGSGAAVYATSAAGIGVNARHTAAGALPAVQGQSNGGNGTGIKGIDTNGDLAKGVWGLSNTGYGGFFQAPGPGGDGVSALGGLNGVRGDSPEGTGVLGVHTGSASSSSAGVEGQSSASNGTGIKGTDTNGGLAKGVWGLSDTGYGGFFQAPGPGGDGVSALGGLNGVRGDSPGGTGVFGKSGSGTGVHGEGGFYGGEFLTTAMGGGTAAGVIGKTNGANNGVWGESLGGGTGVHGSGETGGFFQGGSDSGATGVVGTVSGAGKGVRGQAGSGGAGVSGSAPAGGYAGQFEGEVDVQGYLKLRVLPETPAAADCSQPAHVGRMAIFMFTTSLGGMLRKDPALYICGTEGWRHEVFVNT